MSQWISSLVLWVWMCWNSVVMFSDRLSSCCSAGVDSLRRCFEFFGELDMDFHKRFFRNLGLNDNVIKSKESLPYEDKVHELLNIWVEHKGRDASLNELLQVLLDLNQRRTAEMVKEKVVQNGYYCCQWLMLQIIKKQTVWQHLETTHGGVRFWKGFRRTIRTTWHMVNLPVSSWCLQASPLVLDSSWRNKVRFHPKHQHHSDLLSRGSPTPRSGTAARRHQLPGTHKGKGVQRRWFVGISRRKVKWGTFVWNSSSGNIRDWSWALIYFNTEQVCSSDSFYVTIVP